MGCAREVTARMSDLVWATNPRHDALDNLTAYLREQAARQFEGTRISAHLDFPAEVPDIHVSATFRRNVLLVTKEAINNIVKHAGATMVRIQFQPCSTRLSLRIEDNGCGFDPWRQNNAGNGLSNMRRRVLDLEGRIDLQSRPGGGTRIEICLPWYRS